MLVPVRGVLGARLLTLVVCFVVGVLPAFAQRIETATYSVMPPTGWTKQTKDIVAGGVAFLGPQEKDFTVNINVMSEPAPRETLAQYVQAIHRQVTPGGEMTILKDTPKVLLAGTQAHRMLTELHLKKRTDVPILRVHQIYAMHKDRAFILTLTYPKSVTQDSEKKYIAAFNKLIASFQWKKEATGKK